MQLTKLKLPLSSDMKEVPRLVKSAMIHGLKEKALIQNQEFWGREIPKKLRFKGGVRSIPKLFRDELVNSWLQYRHVGDWKSGRIYLVMGWAYGQSTQGFEHMFTGYINRWLNDWYDRKYLLFVSIPCPPSVVRHDYDTHPQDLLEHRNVEFVPAVGSSLPMASEFSFDRHKDSWLFRRT